MGEENFEYELVVNKRDLKSLDKEALPPVTNVEGYSDLNKAIAALLTIELPLLDQSYCKRQNFPFFIEHAYVRNKQMAILISLSKIDNSISDEEGFKVMALSDVDYIPEELLISNERHDLMGRFAGYNVSCLLEYFRENDEFRYQEGYLAALPHYRERVFEMENLDKELPYLLRLTGTEMTKTAQVQGGMVLRGIIEEKRFGSLQEAFGALISIETACFDGQVSYVKELRKDYESAVIINKISRETEMAMMQIRMEDSPDGVPIPGMYIQFSEEMSSFEKRTNIGLTDFGEYDAGDVHLLISRYRYDQGIQLVDDPALADLREKVSQVIGGIYNDEQQPYLLRQEFNFQAKMPIEEWSEEDYKGIKQYYFSDVGRALFYLVSIDPYKLDPELSKRAGPEYITGAFLYDNLGKKIAGIENLPSFTLSTNDLSSLYLVFPKGRSFWDGQGIDLSMLNYSDHISNLVPHSRLSEFMPMDFRSNDRNSLVLRNEIGELKTQLSLEGHNLHRKNVQAQLPTNYVLEIEKVVKLGYDTKNVIYDRIRVPSIKEGLKQMESYQYELFNPVLASQNNLGFYIKSIRLIDQANDQEILKRLGSEELLQSLGSVYQVNAMNLTVEVLLKFRDDLLVKADPDTANRIIIITSKLEDIKIAIQKRTENKRDIGRPDNSSGMKL